MADAFQLPITKLTAGCNWLRNLLPLPTGNSYTVGDRQEVWLVSCGDSLIQRPVVLVLGGPVPPPSSAVGVADELGEGVGGHHVETAWK